MKIFYLSILTLFTITHSDASDLPEADAQLTPAEVTLEHVQASVKKIKRPTTPSSVSGSVRGSYAGSYVGSLGMASTIARHDVYTPTDVDDKSEAQKITEYNKLLDAYTDLLAIMSRTDARLTQFVAGIDRALPKGIERSSADEENLTSLQTAFRQLLKMYRTAQKLYDSKTGKVTVLESTIAELTAAQTELQATLATMAPRPTEFVGTDMSPARKAAIAADDVENSDVVADLRARLAESDAEKDRLQAEIAALKTAATRANKPATKAGIKEPLLPKDGYTHLNDRSTGKPNKKDGCPSCSVQ